MFGPLMRLNVWGVDKVPVHEARNAPDNKPHGECCGKPKGNPNAHVQILNMVKEKVRGYGGKCLNPRALTVYPTAAGRGTAATGPAAGRVQLPEVYSLAMRCKIIVVS